MKVLLISPATKKNVDPLTTPLGLLSIATYLKKHGHTVIIYESAVNKGRFRKTLREFSPDVVGVSVISGKAVKDAIRLSKIAQKTGHKVIWGGFLASALPEQCLKTGCVDIISIGEGEHTWLDLLNCFTLGSELDSIKGIAFLKDNEVVRTHCRDLIDLRTLPDLEWELIDVNKYFYHYYSSSKTISLYTSKGCPGHCTFCYNSDFNKSIQRTRPYEQVVRELKHLIQNYGLECACFNDDLMFANKEQMYSFCNAIKAAGLSFYWGCGSIVGIFEKEDFQRMYEAGCRWILFGIESGSERMLKHIKKGIKYNQIEQTIVVCESVGIVARAAFIVGFPYETQEDLKQTVSLALRLRTTQISVNYYSPVPNSEEYSRLLKDNRISPPNTLDDFIGKYPFDRINKNFSDIPNKDLNVVYSYLVIRRFFKNHSTQDKKSWKNITFHYILKALKEMSVSNLFRSFDMVFRSFFTVIFNPGIRKKYGLHEKSKP